jgi:lipopolysaccharide biosynthesis regulator YciM
MDALILALFFSIPVIVGAYYLYERIKADRSVVDQKGYLDALIALLDGDDRRAFTLLREVVAADSSNIDAYLRIGNIFCRNNKPERALQIHQDLSLRHSLDQASKARIFKAITNDYLAMEDYKAAMRSLQEYNSFSGGGDNWSLSTLLRLQEGSGQWEEAALTQERLLKASGELSRKPLAKYKVYAGNKLAEAGQYHQARIAYKEALNLDEQNAEAYLAIGETYMKEDRTNDAIGAWKKLVSNAPTKSAPALDLLEKALFEVGKFGEIEDICRLVIRLDPSTLHARLKLADYFAKKACQRSSLRDSISRARKKIRFIISSVCLKNVAKAPWKPHLSYMTERDNTQSMVEAGRLYIHGMRSCGSRFLYLSLGLLIFTLSCITPVRVLADERSDKLDRIEKLVDQGELSQAQRLLSELSQVSHRSPRELAVRARLKTDGVSSNEFLQAALKVAENPRDRERVYLLSARFYQASESWDSLQMVIRAYEREFKRGELRYEFARLSVFALERTGDYAGAQELVSQMARSASNADVREWATLMKARLQLRSKSRQKEGRRELNRVSASRGSEMAPLALYLTSQEDMRAGDFDGAALNFSILREAYPDAIGSDDLIDGISALDASGGGADGEVERLIGALYSIQVGVFSVKENANNQKKRFELYDKEVEVKRKHISGKSYYAVYVGKFRSAEAAEAFKKTLELSEKALFTIVLRDG